MSSSHFEDTDAKLLSAALTKKINGSPSERIIGFFILLNLVFLLIRPQVVFPILAELKITIGLFLLCFLFWLKRPTRIWQPPIIAVLGLLALHAAMILIGRFLWEDLVLNTGVAASVWLDVVQYLFCFLFPALSYLTFNNQLKRLNAVFILVGAYIGIYAITHNGMGPKGFLGDENDCGLMLAFLFPFALFTYPHSKHFWSKLAIIVAICAMFAGIVSTNSRGTFVGVVCTLLFVFTYSRQKGILLTLGLFGLLATIPFLPADYFDEIKSISHTNEGTAKTRFEYWQTAIKTWADHKNTLQGVGLNNIPWRIQQYQGAEFGLTKAGMGGRQVHSLHVQIIADLGLIGIFILGFATYRSIKGNIQCRRELLQTEKSLSLLKRSYIEANQSDEDLFNINTPARESDRFLHQVINTQGEIRFLIGFFNCLNGAWLALGTAGAFISVLYYPTPWMILVISIATQLYWREMKITLTRAIELSNELLNQ